MVWQVNSFNNNQVLKTGKLWVSLTDCLFQFPQRIFSNIFLLPTIDLSVSHFPQGRQFTEKRDSVRWIFLQTPPTTFANLPAPSLALAPLPLGHNVINILPSDQGPLCSSVLDPSSPTSSLSLYYCLSFLFNIYNQSHHKIPFCQHLHGQASNFINNQPAFPLYLSLASFSFNTQWP